MKFLLRFKKLRKGLKMNALKTNNTNEDNKKNEKFELIRENLLKEIREPKNKAVFERLKNK